MTDKTCFKLRHFNLPERFGDVLKRLADPKGEVCSTGVYLPYTSAFADLATQDYLRLQSEFASKGLITGLHSPDQVRFAKEGLAKVVQDPQQRRSLIETLDAFAQQHRYTVDDLLCTLNQSAKMFATSSTLFPAFNPFRGNHCDDDSRASLQSFAHYYGLTGEQINSVMAKGGSPQNVAAILDGLMSDGTHLPQDAIQLLQTLHNKFDGNDSYLISDWVSALKLLNHGAVVPDIIDLLKKNAGWNVEFLEPLLQEFEHLKLPNPLATLKSTRYPHELFKTIDVMRDANYSDPEIRDMIRCYQAINGNKLAGNFSEVFKVARNENVPFEEVQWVLEEAAGYGDLPLFSDRSVDQTDPTRSLAAALLKAYLKNPDHTRAAAYQAMQDVKMVWQLVGENLYYAPEAYCTLVDFEGPYENRLHALDYMRNNAEVKELGTFSFFRLIDQLKISAHDITEKKFIPAIAEKLEETGNIRSIGDLISSVPSVVDAFAKRLGITPKEAVSDVLGSESELLFDFVLSKRETSLVFDMDQLETYKAITEDLHNHGAGPKVFFQYMSFDYFFMENPPKTFEDVAKVHHVLAAASRTLAERFMGDMAAHWTSLQKSHSAWVNPKTQRIDVTRHNIKEVNQLLAMFATAKATPGSDSNPDVAADYEWFVTHLDVEEIDVRRLPAETYSDYYELIQRLQDANAKSSSRYLTKRVLELDARKIFGDAMTDIKKIEAIRKKSNESYPHLGDLLIDNLGISMLEGVAPTIFNIGKLQQIAKLWNVKDNNAVFRDDRGLYLQYTYFAYQMLSDVILEKTSDWRDKDKIENLKTFLTSQNISLDALVAELNAEGFPIMSEGDWDKARNRIATDPGYVLRRGAQKMTPSALQTDNMTGLTAKVAADWALRNGVTVKVVSNSNGKEIARAIQCDRAVMGAEILLNSHALVDTEARKAQLGAAYVFSAPLNMTTPDNRTMTEIAYQNGAPMNWLMSARGKDGLLLVDKSHSPRILDKRKIQLSQMLDESDLKRPEIKEALDVWLRRCKLDKGVDRSVLDLTFQPFKRLEDKVLFREIMRAKAFSLLNGMLFTADSGVHLEKENGSASRRLFAEFANGKFGVVDGTEYLTTAEAFEAAKAAGATKAIYMDTGFWDQADYVDGKGESHRLDPGHSKSSASTNRVVIRVK